MESGPVLSRPGEFQEPWLRRQPKPERTPGDAQRRRKLAFRGIAVGVIFLALVASAVLLRPYRGRIAEYLDNHKKLAPGETSHAEQASQGRTRKSTRRPRQVDDKLTESQDPEAPSPGAEVTTLSQQPNPLQREVQELSNQRRLIQLGSGPVVRLRNWGMEGRIQVSGELPEKQELPTYPPVALRNRVQGAVVLRAWTGKNGSVQRVQVLSGPSILAPAAVDAVRRWRYKPYYQASEPPGGQKQITIEFTIPAK